MRARWILLAAALAVAAFAIVVGGSLWPRPQFSRGPWVDPATAGSALAETLGTIPADQWLNAPAGGLSGADLRGDVVLVEFWTYFCTNCKNVEPWMKETHAALAPEGLVVIGVHTPEFEVEREVGNVRAYVRENGIVWPVAIDNGHEVWRKYNATRAWPAFLVFDRAGRLVYRRAGERAVQGARTAIEKALRIPLALSGEAVTFGAPVEDSIVYRERDHRNQICARREVFGERIPASWRHEVEGDPRCPGGPSPADRADRFRYLLPARLRQRDLPRFAVLSLENRRIGGPDIQQDEPRRSPRVPGPAQRFDVVVDRRAHADEQDVGAVQAALPGSQKQRYDLNVRLRPHGGFDRATQTERLGDDPHAGHDAISPKSPVCRDASEAASPDFNAVALFSRTTRYGSARGCIDNDYTAGTPGHLSAS